MSEMGHLRGVKWRIDLGILPNTSSIHDLRRLTADSRRRYASLRRQLLIDPHVPSNSSNLVMDNPLSQNPDSMWSRFFRNAELERMVDQDLSRLYPEHGSYFQTPACQAMLRRILLLWCLGHPHFGYRQGMHELLAPLLYVLQADIEQLSEVRNLYEDHFTDKFDGFSFNENDFTYKNFYEDESRSEKSPVKITSLSELDPMIQVIVLVSDAYGTEGELGVLLSEKFMEHDVYCMFDALMNGGGGAVAMAEFFSHTPLYGAGLLPVIEASAALYHLLSLVDSSLHIHLVELGVEPQYFALRWLRVLFGREFALEDLLIIWDEIFACQNNKLEKSSEVVGECSCRVLNSHRGAFISAFAVTMILHLRPSLLATEISTLCLQKLLNFPDDTSLEKLIERAKSLQALAVDANNSTPLIGSSNFTVMRGNSHSTDLSSPKTPLSLVPESYWEEKWRVVLKEEESKQNSIQKHVSNQRKGWSEKLRLRLTRTESNPSPSKVDKIPKLSIRKNLLKDVSQELGSDKPVHENVQDGNNKDLSCSAENMCSRRNCASECAPIFSNPSSPIPHTDDPEDRSDNSVASNFYADENDVNSCTAEVCGANLESSSLPFLDPSKEEASLYSEPNKAKCTSFKERIFMSGKLQRLWKFGRNADEGTSERSVVYDSTKTCNGGNNLTSPAESSTTDASNNNGIIKGDTIDENLIVMLRNLGQSMCNNIQVIECEFQQDEGQVGTSVNHSKNVLGGKSEVTALAALEELRKISNILSEM